MPTSPIPSAKNSTSASKTTKTAPPSSPGSTPSRKSKPSSRKTSTPFPSANKTSANGAWAASANGSSAATSKTIAREIVRTARDLHENLDLPSLPGHLAASLATRYAALLNTWGGEPAPGLAEKLRLLHALTRDVALLQRTLHQSAEQARQRHQQTEADRKNEIAAARKKILNPIWAARQEAALAGLFGNGKAGEYLAKVVTAVNFDLPLPQPDPALEAEIKAESKEPAKTPRARKPKEDASANETTPTEPPLEPTPSTREVKASQSSNPTLTTAPEPTPDEPEINQTTLPKLQMTNSQ